MVSPRSNLSCPPDIHILDRPELPEFAMLRLDPVAVQLGGDPIPAELLALPQLNKDPDDLHLFAILDQPALHNSLAEGDMVGEAVVVSRAPLTFQPLNPQLFKAQQNCRPRQTRGLRDLRRRQAIFDVQTPKNVWIYNPGICYNRYAVGHLGGVRPVSGKVHQKIKTRPKAGLVFLVLRDFARHSTTRSAGSVRNGVEAGSTGRQI